jgi:hypothetical protein
MNVLTTCSNFRLRTSLIIGVLCLAAGETAAGQFVQTTLRPNDGQAQRTASILLPPRGDLISEARNAVAPSAFTVGHSRQTHILIGVVSGLVIGASVGAIIGNSGAKRCHAESCQVSAALGSGADILAGGLSGIVLGAFAGAV